MGIYIILHALSTYIDLGILMSRFKKYNNSTTHGRVKSSSPDLF